MHTSRLLGCDLDDKKMKSRREVGRAGIFRQNWVHTFKRSPEFIAIKHSSECVPKAK